MLIIGPSTRRASVRFIARLRLRRRLISVVLCVARIVASRIGLLRLTLRLLTRQPKSVASLCRDRQAGRDWA
jgi:hypothetical protein